MGNISTILNGVGVGGADITEAGLKKTSVRVKQLWAAFELLPGVPGSFICHEGNIVTNNGEAVTHLSAPKEIIEIVLL